jgi:cytochrome o ubiquinol oxidase operon protein cyoD
MSNHNEIVDIKAGNKILGSNIVGFVLSVIFMVLAFYLVEKRIGSTDALYTWVTILAVLQIISQVIFFLRMNGRTEDDRWNRISLIFTILIIAIVVCGSLWIMYNLNYNMIQNYHLAR